MTEAAPGRLPTGWRKPLLLVARVAFTVAVLSAVTYAIASQWTDVRDTLARLSPQALAGSFVMVLLGLAAQTLAFQAALRDLGHRVAVRTAGQVYLVGLLAKYLPGSVWMFVLQTALGRRAGIPRSRAFIALLVCFGLSMTAALVLGVFGLPVLLRLDPVITALVLVLVPGALACAHPRLLTWLVQRFLALVRRPPLEQPLTWVGVASVTGWLAVSWLCLGVHLWVLAGGGVGLLSATGAFALGLTAGTLAFLSPSGLGVRESIVAAALLPSMPLGPALGVALASRLIFTIADVVAALIAAVSGGTGWARRPSSRDREHERVA